MFRYLLLALLLLTLLGGCTTLRETQPAQTAREQLLLSTAADQASAQIAPNVPAGNLIYVDTTNFGAGEEYQGQYAITSIKAALLRLGYGLAASANEADTILEVSSGALSINERGRLFGIPSSTIPIPLAGTFTTPEVAIWKSKERTGIAKFLLAFYNAETGTLQDVSEPVYGFSNFNQFSILFFGTTESDLLPPDVE